MGLMSSTWVVPPNTPGWSRISRDAREGPDPWTQGNTKTVYDAIREAWAKCKELQDSLRDLRDLKAIPLLPGCPEIPLLA
jgi:hypothetical protein